VNICVQKSSKCRKRSQERLKAKSRPKVKEKSRRRVRGEVNEFPFYALPYAFNFRRCNSLVRDRGEKAVSDV
jgi:hypothetical protein